MPDENPQATPRRLLLEYADGECSLPDPLTSVFYRQQADKTVALVGKLYDLRFREDELPDYPAGTVIDASAGIWRYDGPVLESIASDMPFERFQEQHAPDLKEAWSIVSSGPKWFVAYYWKEQSRFIPRADYLEVFYQAAIRKGIKIEKPIIEQVLTPLFTRVVDFMNGTGPYARIKPGSAEKSSSSGV